MKISEILSKPTIEDAKEYLNTLPEDELFTAAEISEAVGVPPSTIRHSPYLKEFRVMWDGNIYFGSQLAIAQFKEDAGDEN